MVKVLRKVLISVVFTTLFLTACGDNPTPAPGAVVEVTRIVEVTKIVEVTRMVAAPTTSAPAATTPAATLAPTNTEAAPKTTVPPTTTASREAYVTLVVNSKRNQDMVETRKAKEGFTFIVLDLTITNNSEKPVSNGFTYFQVLSDQSFAYGYSDITFNMPKGMKSTDLAKGESTRGEIAFEVPTGEVIKSIRFEDFTGKVTIAIP